MDSRRDKYLQGRLSEAEKRAFEQTLSDQEKEDLAFELGVREGLESEFRNELRNAVKGFEKKTKTNRVSTTFIGIAASVVIIASTVLYLLNPRQSLFDQYYQVYPNYESTTVRGEGDIELREQAYRAYDTGDYESAESLFSQLINQDPSDIPSIFFRGISLIQLEQIEEAGQAFELVREKGTQYKDPATWYLALIYIESKELEQAKELLTSLAESQDYSTKAQELLNSL